MEEKDLEYVEEENDEIENIDTSSNKKTNKELVARGENFDFNKLFKDLKETSKDVLSQENKKYNSKINKVLGNILYRANIANQVENSLRNANLIETGGKVIDGRCINNICFMIGSPKNKTFKKQIDEFILEELEYAKIIIKYPYIDEKETGNTYHKLHRENIKKYTDKLYNYYTHDFYNVVKKVDSINFSKLSETDIFKIYASVISNQDLFDNFRAYEMENFEEQFDTYEKNKGFNNLSSLVNVTAILFTAECFERGIDLKSINLGFHLGPELDDEGKPTFGYYYSKDFNKSLFNYYKNDEILLVPVKRFGGLSDKQIDEYSYLIEQFFGELNSRGTVSKTLYLNDVFETIYIDSKCFTSIIKDKLGDRYNSMDPLELRKYQAREFLKMIESGDKLVEYAEINTFKDTYTIEVKPVTFDYSNRTIKKRYENVLKASKVSPLKRHDKIISSAKTKIEEAKKTNNKIKKYKEELVHSRDYNAILSQFIFKYNKDNVNSLEFEKFINQVFIDAKSRNLDEKIDRNILRDIDASPMFKDKEAVRHSSTILSREHDFAMSFVKYALHANNVSLTTSTSRDAIRYFLSLKRDTAAERTNKTFRYIKACQLRDADPSKCDYSLMREITNELINDMLNARVNTNLSTSEGILHMNARMNQAFLIRQTFDADKDYFNKFREEEPYKYYQLMEKCAYYERYSEDTKFETTSLAGFTNANNKIDPQGLVSYSRGTNSMFYNPNINISRNLNAINIAFFENSYTNKSVVNLNLDMSVYGALGKDNDLVYDHLNELSLDDFVNEASRIEGIGEDGNTEDVIDVYGTVGLSIKSVNTMLSFYKNSFETQRELVNDFLEDKNYNDYFLSSICLNGRSLKDLASEYKESHNIELKEFDLASAIFAHGINDPSKVVTFTNLVFKNNVISAKTCVVNKNYDYLTKRTKDNHTVVQKIGHAFGMKYNSEKMEKNQQDNLKQFNNETLNRISKNFENKYINNFEHFNSKFVIANAKEKLNELNSVEILNRRNLEVDLKENKIIDVNNKENIKDTSKAKEDLKK